MSMRLIDADLLKKNCKIDGSFENNFQGVSLDTLGRVIDNQPTAYDIDKVVEELEKEKYNALEVEQSISDYQVWCEAIEIVKRGGNNEDN